MTKVIFLNIFFAGRQIQTDIFTEITALSVTLKTIPITKSSNSITQHFFYDSSSSDMDIIMPCVKKSTASSPVTVASEIQHFLTVRSLRLCKLESLWITQNLMYLLQTPTMKSTEEIYENSMLEDDPNRQNTQHQRWGPKNKGAQILANFYSRGRESRRTALINYIM